MQMAAVVGRLGNVNAALPQASKGGSITMGLAELRTVHMSDALVSRVDSALYLQRRASADTR